MSLLFGLSLALLSPSPEPELSLGRVFGDHMVLQRGEPVRFFGRARPGASVLSIFAGQARNATADAQGAWSLEFDALAAGGPHMLEVACGEERLFVEDILIGDVFLCAGQSNMEWPMSKAQSAGAEIPLADLPELRLFDMVGAGQPTNEAWDADTLARCNTDDYYTFGPWQVCTPGSVADFSAVAYFFGRELQEHLDVPIGLIHNAIGGTTIESYISPETLRANVEVAGTNLEGASWLEEEAVPEWPKQRARTNLAAWLEKRDGEAPGHPFQPGFLFDAGVRPLTPFGIRGVLWYQGESNATAYEGRGEEAIAGYQHELETWIADWRRAFGKEQLPFLHVQLPGLNRPWMEFREAQRRVSADSHVGMAVTIDLGHPTDVHPRNKREVGRRLALVARALIYGEPAEACLSPSPTGLDREIPMIKVLAFENAGDGLRLREGSQLRLELIHEGGKWERASSAFVQSMFLRTQSGVIRFTDMASEELLAVRYGWEPLPDAVVETSRGLPVGPFLVGEAPTMEREVIEEEDGTPLFATSFEGLAPGSFERHVSDAATWTASDGHAVIDAAHHRTGKQCLHLVGGEARQVELELSKDEPVGSLEFWAERWTRREPFEFRIEEWRDGAWASLYRGDDEVVIGTFKTKVRIPLGRKLGRLRFSCTSPSGVLIDDLSFTPARAMELAAVRTRSTVVPLLVGTQRNPLTSLLIEAQGALEPRTLEEVRVDLRATDGFEDITAVEVVGPDDVVFGWAQPPADTLVFRGHHALVEGENEWRVTVTLAEDADVDQRIGATVVGAVFTDAGGGEEERPLNYHLQPTMQRLAIPLRSAGDDGSAAYRIPGIVTTPQGTLIAVYDIRWKGWGDLPGDIDVGMSRSTDGGRTWEPMRTILDMGDHPAFRHDGVGDPSILVDDDTGTIWVAATWSHGNRAWRGSGPGLAPTETGQLMLTRSDDDGRTWSAPINITRQVKRPEWAYLLQGPGRGITMHDGTLVFPAQYQDSLERGRVPHSTILYSRDHGETWEIGTGAKRNTTEAQVVELEDGTLMLNMRDNRRGSRSVAITKDLGRTWQAHETSRRDLIEPTCNAALLRASATELVFCNPAVSAPPRRNMALKLSPDLGETWLARSELRLDSGQSAGYPALTMIDAETVGVLFEGSRAHMTFMRIPIADLRSAR